MATVRSKILRSESSEGEFEAYRAALEWDLIDPIVIENEKDIKSASRWEEQIKPYHHQVTNLMTFCRRLPVTLLADDVGLGKTISAGLIISELVARSRISKVLIVCPKLLGPQWKEELETKFGISAHFVIGKDLIDADSDEIGAVITTYNSARLYMDQIPIDRFQMLILDEAHKLRNLYGVGRAPQVALKFKEALLQRRFQYVLMLTATPIQNRLWDLYSLVDLLSVARGHENPFGSEGIFARKFIADDREIARKLKMESKDDFRSIVYGYMSRVRRGDAKLYFPDRVVQMHKVTPSQGELDLIATIAEPIQELNRLTQISILQALASSPDALNAQLQNMARNGTVPAELALEVKAIVSRLRRSAKLDSLGALIEKLKKENPEKWRLVVFTTRRETQTTIEAFLSELGLKVGLINGSTAGKNQDTIKRFRMNPPELNVIVSTEAGSEGVNLQVANILVNFDLPWNPMVVEQRIGRIQRLASEHASVGIFNMVLTGTFEESIVGRLMEKLQLASNAIGDIESLLEASGINGEDENGGMDEKIRALVVSALAGKDVDVALKMADESIENAKMELERERNNIDSLLGSLDGAEYTGPRTPSLPDIIRSMTPKEFVIAAYMALGGRIIDDTEKLIVEHDGRTETISFDNSETYKSTNYSAGSPAFSTLVTRMSSTGIHKVTDASLTAEQNITSAIKNWSNPLNLSIKNITVGEAQRSFIGKALVKVNAYVQHDSYERLVEVSYNSKAQATQKSNKNALLPIGKMIDDVEQIGINPEIIMQMANDDHGISEFCRFYLERRDLEVRAAGGDQRKKHKLIEDFTPKVEMTIVSLEGVISRTANVRADYTIDNENLYSNAIFVDCDNSRIIDLPKQAVCAQSSRNVPINCLDKCQISNKMVISHLLKKSDISSRVALPEHIVCCTVSSKNLLSDECSKSDITGNLVDKNLLETSIVSGKKGEPSYFGECEFSKESALKTELKISAISKKRYRQDKMAQSEISSRTGHESEFVTCHETRKLIASDESEKCDISSVEVRKGILSKCEISHKNVVPDLLVRCSISSKLVLKSLTVESSVSGQKMIVDLAVKSRLGKYCSPSEVGHCDWSGCKSHPEDISNCSFTNRAVHFNYLENSSSKALLALIELLKEQVHTRDLSEDWISIEALLDNVIRKGKCKIIATTISPNKSRLAARAELKQFLGLKKSSIGFLYDTQRKTIVGKFILGKCSNGKWVQDIN